MASLYFQNSGFQNSREGLGSLTLTAQGLTKGPLTSRPLRQRLSSDMPCWIPAPLPLGRSLVALELRFTVGSLARRKEPGRGSK